MSSRLKSEEDRSFEGEEGKQSEGHIALLGCQDPKRQNLKVLDGRSWMVGPGWWVLNARWQSMMNGSQQRTMGLARQLEREVSLGW